MGRPVPPHPHPCPILEASMSDSPITDPLAWRPVKAPSLLDLEILAGAVFAGLPEKFRALCEGLVIRVEDFADDDVLDDMEIDDPFALMGLFQGVGLPFQSDSTLVQMAGRAPGPRYPGPLHFPPPI